MPAAPRRPVASSALAPIIKSVGGRLLYATGQPAKREGKVVVLWQVSAGSPDYIYAWGEGNVDGGRYRIDFRSAPPADALNRGLLGVGFVVMLPPNASLPRGKLTRPQWRALEKQIIGGVSRASVVYRYVTKRVMPGWIGRFPAGFTCGRGQKEPGSRFEGHGLTNCAKLDLTVAPFRFIKIVNWT